MTVSSRIALGYAILRGIQLTVLTVPWVLQKVRRADAAEAERSLVFMIGSRSILLGLAIVALGITNRGATLGWVLLGDGVLQLCDAVLALGVGKRTLAVLPAVLCLLDVAAAIVLLG